MNPCPCAALHYVTRQASKYYRVQEKDPVARPSAHPLFVTTQMDSQKSLIYIEMFLAYLSTSVKKNFNPCLGNSNLLLRPYRVTTAASVREYSR